MPGPVPKKDTQRRRRTDPAKGPATKARGKVTTRPGAGDWHPAMVLWYDSLADSGQSEFYASSDWSTAYVAAESMSRELQPQPMTVGKGDDAHVEMVSLPPKAATLAAWLKACTALMATEGDRRRLRLELEQPGAAQPKEGSGVARFADYQKRLGPAG